MQNDIQKLIHRLAQLACLLAGLLAANAVFAQKPETVQLAPQLGLGDICSVDLSRDGKLLLSGSEDELVRLWDVLTGYQIRFFAGRVGALSPDGSVVATGSSSGLVQTWDTRSGKLLHIFAGHTGRINSIIFSADGQRLVTGSFDNTARLWNVSTGVLIETFTGHTAQVNRASLSHDGTLLLTSSDDHTARLSDTNSGKTIRIFSAGEDTVKDAVLSPDGHSVLTGGRRDTDAHRYDAPSPARLWDVATGQSVRTFAGNFGYFETVDFAPDGQQIVTGTLDGMARIWNLSAGTVQRSFDARDGPAAIDFLNATRYSADGRYLLTGGSDCAIRLWDARTGKLLRVFRGHTARVESLAASADGGLLLIGASDARARLWDMTTGRLSATFPLTEQSEYVRSVDFAPGGEQILLGGLFSGIDLWDLATAKRVRTFAKEASPARFTTDGRAVVTRGKLWDRASGQLLRNYDGDTAFSPDGSIAVTWSSLSEMDQFVGSHFETTPDGRLIAVKPPSEGEAWVRDTRSGAEIHRINDAAQSVLPLALLPGDHQLLATDSILRIRDLTTGAIVRSFADTLDLRGGSVTLSPDGKTVLTGSMTDADVHVWNVESGTEVSKLSGHTAPVNTTAFLDDARFIVSGSEDTTTRLWDRKTGTELATLISFDGEGWAVVDPQGRFDTSDLEGTMPLVWIASSNPLRPMPLEIFERDYYTPGLLARILKGETLPEVRAISEIPNRTQPEVQIVSVTASAKTIGRVDVTVHAASHINSRTKQTSGLTDLRLFRNGQLIPAGYRSGALTDGDFVFRDVALRSGATAVTFTAYAFSSERIKSPTATLTYLPQPASKPNTKPHAYLLQIGENHYAATSCELQYAGNDAVIMSESLSTRLQAAGYEVNARRLISSLAMPGGVAPGGAAFAALPASDNATKLDIRNAIEAIVKVATPDDIFLLSFSGHGYSNKTGQFYLLPSDIRGACNRADSELLAGAISADDLAEWLRPMDAGEMVLILDACHSAESVEAGQFKAGPLGSKGLGQLAYDKRMRILAASQAEQTAGEYDLLHQGLLSYVLTRDGLTKAKADWRPLDQKITLGEWLAYGMKAVPRFDPSSILIATPKAAAADPKAGSKQRPRVSQTPALFDFSANDPLRLQ